MGAPPPAAARGSRAARGSAGRARGSEGIDGGGCVMGGGTAARARGSEAIGAGMAATPMPGAVLTGVLIMSSFISEERRE